LDALDLSTFLENLAQGYGDRVQLRLGELPDQLRIQPDHLESALRNLLDNAVRHGSGQPVTLEAETDGGRVRIRVRNQGPGISARNRERIFDRFFTTERDTGGTGLGLAIARAVAETRGGSLTLLDDPSGTCFELTL
jgi:signal transduction histidine kinase